LGGAFLYGMCSGRESVGVRLVAQQ
jgi:hypothetical protein